jgi:hypothetical protein
LRGLFFELQLTFGEKGKKLRVVAFEYRWVWDFELGVVEF